MRTGKLKGITKIVIPYLDTEGERQYSLLTIEGTSYASKIYSGIKDFVKKNFELDVDKDWLHNVPLIVNQYDPEFAISDEERAERIEKFIQSMELKDDDEAESFPDTRGTPEDASTATEQVCTLPYQDDISRCLSGSLPCDRECTTGTMQELQRRRGKSIQSRSES